MKAILIRCLQVCALLTVLAITSYAQESRRGIYEGDLAGGGKIVFFLQGNYSISAYVFDVAGNQASFAGGTVEDNSTFTLTLTPAGAVTGTVTPTAVIATVLGQDVTANHVRTFGDSEHFGGRFTAIARSTTSDATYNLKIVLDSQKNIFFIAQQGSTVLGGFGAIALPAGTPSPSCTPHHGGMGGGHCDDMGDAEDHHHGHDFEGADELEDHYLDDNSHGIAATFNLTLVTGEDVTGHLNVSHGLLLGDFTLGGVTYGFRAPHESSQHHMANISTRGFVSTGQGQLIGGFILRGGPKMVIVRASGPSLAAAGVSPALADPQLQLFQNGTLVAQNDNWQDASNVSDLIATTIPPADPKEAAILIRLEPGSYTTIVTGANNGTGISLVEVYEIDRD
jgi:hypothetical protein